ncbi:MAG TPA: beta-ketoacyl-ACP synthase III [Elusimicrobiota bacterium]|nr:beta-ketoacyl-ACP synthase III [Elusimicrobiota bacterium]
MGLKFVNTGASLPEKILTNADLERIVDTTDEWITTRTGIKERRIASAQEATSDFSIRAARKALEGTPVNPEDIQLIIVATTTPDHFFPSVACLVQKALGAKNAAAFDVSAACSGFIYALTCARGLIESGDIKYALVIGADVLTKFADWKDRATCVLFGDGAGALLIEKTDGPGDLLSAFIGADGSQSDILSIPGGGSRHPYNPETWSQHPAFIHMEGKEVFKHAVTRMIEASLTALRQCGKTSDDLKLLIPHQANLRIIDAIAKRLQLPDDKVFKNVHKYGNMSAATTIIALDEAQRGGRLQRGDLVELIAFGAGMTWGACVLRW